MRVKGFVNFVQRLTTMLSKNELKYVRSLAVGKFRKQHNAFVAEGSKVIEEFINEGWKIDKIYSTSKDEFRNFNGDCIEVTGKELNQLSSLRTPQDALAIIDIPPVSNLKRWKEGSGFILACDGIQDPGNLGSIVRIADWFGIDTMICSEKCADVYNPKVVQATMGSLARVKVHTQNLTDFIEANEMLPVIVATLNGSNMYKMELPDYGLIVLGSESKGVSPELQSMAEYNLKISGKGKAESLNVAVSAGIICAELVGRRNG